MRALILGSLLAAAPVMAEVTSTGPDGFVSRNEAVIARPPADVWKALTRWNLWWDPAHSYSGKLTLNPNAGGMLSESWPGGSIVHATVVAALPGELLRMHGGFGPLQNMPATAVLNFMLKPEGAGTRLTMIYTVGGPAFAGLDKLAAPVDAVMSAGFQRLQRFAATP
jgi:uncharacterized protein YndB with AHSA1/START domain